MNKEKIESEIKELNAIRAMHHRDFKEIEKRYNKKLISDKNFGKQKRKYNSKIEKIKEKIRRLEEKNHKKDREKRYLEWSV
jgi:hypothetical protein